MKSIVSILTIAAMIFSAALVSVAAPLAQNLSSKSGIAWSFQPEGGDWTTIQVPDGGWVAQGFDCEAGNYRATITIPAFSLHERVLINFAAINFGADVLIGPDEAHLTHIVSHVDGWVPLVADITDAVKPGEKAVLEVQVAGREKFKANGRYTVPEGASWCPSLEEGILRGVDLTIVPAIRVSDVYVKTSVLQDTFASAVTVRNDDNSTASVTLQPTLSSWSATHFHYPKIAPVTVQVPAHSSIAADFGPVKWGLGPTSYWWPNVPYRPGYRTQLHVLKVIATTAIASPQTTITRFGFREFAAIGTHYYLNGIHCNLRGDNLQEANFKTDAYGIRPGFGPPTAENAGWPQAVDNLERLNFNVMRIHQIPATPYMLDVCDELGLMLIEESPLRGSERREDYADGKDNMLNMDRELVLRDRNHPSTIIWSAANEWSDPIVDANAAIKQLDDTRPIIGDGIGDPGHGLLFTQHYVNGLDALPSMGANPLPDRPYGEGEAIWPADNTLQGFTWMATGTLLRRLKGDADIRNYTLNNAWPNFVPGEDPSNEIIEKHVKHMGGDEDILPAIAEPWTNPNILLMQQKYNPVAVADVDFDTLNAESDLNGSWPTLMPRLSAGTTAVRHIVVFNDEFSGKTVDLTWSAHADSVDGATIAKGDLRLTIPLGEFITKDISFPAPVVSRFVYLTLTTSKNGVVRETVNNIGYKVVIGSADLIPVKPL